MIGRIITNWHLSKAAVIVQNLLEMHGKGSDVATTAGSVANKLVGSVYDEAPPLFEGKEGKRPHKFSLAAAALAKGVKLQHKSDYDQLCFNLALGTILLEITGKPQNYALSSNDYVLLGLAQDVYMEALG